MAYIFERPAQHAVRNAITQRSSRATYIREGLKQAGYSPEVADLADLMRGDRDALTLDMTEPGERQAAEWFVKMLAENQHNIKFVQRFGKWRSLPGRRYPLPNEDHASAALADMQKDTSLSEKDRRHIRAMVHYRFPDIEIAK